MKYQDDPERASILALLSGKLPEAEFLRQRGWSASDARRRGLSLLDASLTSRDPDDVFFGNYLIGHFGAEEVPLGTLHALLRADWHRSHEDLVQILSKRGDPESAVPLFEAATARYNYLDYDDSFTLGRKSIFALARLGTEAAQELLRRLASCGNLVLESCAREQLGKVQQGNTPG